MDYKEKSKVLLERLYKVLNTNFDRAFALDISDTSIELAELSKLFRFSLENFGRTEIPDGIIKDGRILDEAKLTEQIKILLQNVKPRRVSTNRVILSLPESQIFTHHFVLNTPLRKEALRALVQKEIVKILPISPLNMYWEIKSTDISIMEVGVIFVGIPKDVADSYIRVCNNVGLSTIGFGLEPLSIARLLIPAGPQITAIVDIGSNVTDISIIKGNSDLFVTISYSKGGRTMTEAIAQGQSIDLVSAEQKKQAIGSGASEEIFFLIEPVVKDIATEAKRVIRYFESISKEKVEKILLVGGGSVIGGIKEKMSEIVGIPTETAVNFNNLDNLQYLSNKKYGTQDSTPALFTSVLGLGMLGASNEFEYINLLKQIPSSKLNEIKRSELFRAGYLSKWTAFRIFLNSRIMLAVSLVLTIASLGLFGFLVFKYRLDDVKQVKVYTTFKESNESLDEIAARTLGGINASSTATSTASSTQATATSTKGTATTTSPGIVNKIIDNILKGPSATTTKANTTENGSSVITGEATTSTPAKSSGGFFRAP